MAALPSVIGIRDFRGRLSIGNVTVGLDEKGVPSPVPSEQAPASYVGRPELTDNLLAFLLSDEPAPKGRAIATAVYGLGGIGKTTAVRWLTWRPEIEQRFCDGRIWITVGDEPPDAIVKITDCVSQLDPLVKIKASEEAARADLAAVLQDKSVLFVIDDVWPGKSAEVAKALIVPSARSRFLLTTRFPDLADDIQARAFPYPSGEYRGRLDVRRCRRTLPR